ncbi:MAG: hypothetical protein ACOX19_00630 [Fermentimonas sp.]|jgi:neutral ceramidase
MKSYKNASQFLCFVTVLLMLGISTSAITGANPEVANEPDKVFMAGAATSNITPSLGGGIIGNFGTPPPATYIHDELHARCLTLDDGATKLVFIIVDNLGLSRELIDEAKDIIQKETGIAPSNVLISAIHTHSSIRAEGDYQKFIVRRLGDVVRIALNNLEPASVGWGVGNVPEHVHVRRWIMKPGTDLPDPFGGKDKAKMNPAVGDPNLLEPCAEPDPGVSFISVKSKEGKPIALLANYGLHYVGGVPRGHISADYFAVFADRIQELLKADRQDPPFVGMMSNGTSGDVNSTNRLGKPEKYEPYEKMRHVAENVAREVFRVHGKIEFHDWVPLRAVSEEVAVGVRKPDKKMEDRARYVLNRPDTEKPVHQHEKVYAERILQLLEWPDEINIPLQAFGIGDLAVVTTPFETFAETGLEIKAKSPFKITFTIELANGYYGYLPTPRQHDLGGYETWMGTNKVEREASVKIVDKLLSMLASIK